MGPPKGLTSRLRTAALECSRCSVITCCTCSFPEAVEDLPTSATGIQLTSAVWGSEAEAKEITGTGHTSGHGEGSAQLVLGLCSLGQ